LNSQIELVGGLGSIDYHEGSDCAIIIRLTVERVSKGENPAALFILLTNYLSLMAEISASKAAVFIALFFFAIAGLSGALGRILTQLKGLPGIGGG
jgi:hypothetical protein